MRNKRRNNLCLPCKVWTKKIKKINEIEVHWVADGIKSYIIATNGTDRFPYEIYEQFKQILCHGKDIPYVDTTDDWK